MKKVRMIIKKTITREVECEVVDSLSVANRLIAGDEDAIVNVYPELAAYINKTHCSYEIEDLEVIE